MCSPSNRYFVVRHEYILKKNTGIRSRTKYLKLSNGILFIFSYTAFTSGGKAKWKIYQQHANFYFNISQNHSPNRVCPPSKVSHCSSVTRIRNPSVYLLLKENFSEFSCAEFFSTESHSRSECILIFSPVGGAFESAALISRRPPSWIFIRNIPWELDCEPSLPFPQISISVKNER